MPGSGDGGGKNIAQIEAVKTRRFHNIMGGKYSHQSLKSEENHNDQKIFVSSLLAGSDLEIFQRNTFLDDRFITAPSQIVKTAEEHQNQRDPAQKRDERKRAP